MERADYLKIIRSNLRHNFLFPFLGAVLVGVLTALLFHLKALSATAAMQPIELLLCFTGVMLITSIFLPEQNPAIQEVIYSKWVDYLKVCGIRLVYSVLAVVLINLVVLGIMKWGECEISFFHIVAAIAGALFLGAIGFFVAGVFQNTTVGYMASMGYYLINYAIKKKLGVFNMFSGFTEKYQDKWLLIVWAILLFLATFILLKLRRKK